MRIFHNYSPGLAFQPRFKLGDNPVGSLISGMFGFAGTQSTNETNEDIADWQLAVQMAENQKNRDYNTAEAEKARNFEAEQAAIGRQFTTSEREAQQQFQLQQWEYQQRNQLALQMQGARDAGLNPNVAAGRVMSAQGGSVSAPTGASSPMPGAPLASYSGGLSPVPFQSQNPALAFAQAAQGLASLATAKEKGANVSLIEKQVENMAVDTQYKHVLIDGLNLTQALSKIDLKYHEKKLVQDLTEQVARITSINNTAELSAATAKVQDSFKRLNEVLIGKHSQEATLLALEIGAFDKRLQKQLELQGAQIKEANAKAFESSMNANLSKALKNESKLRSSGLEFDNVIKKIDSDNAAALATDKLYALKMEIDKSKALSREEKARANKEAEKLEYRIKHYKEYPGAVAFDEFFDNLPIIGGLMRGLK